MKMTQAKSGLGLLLFGLACIAVLSIVFYILHSMTSAATTATPSNGVFVYSGKRVQVDWDGGRKRSAGLMFRLSIDQPVAVGNARIFYRGLAANSGIVLDVMLPDLDPEAYYPYTMNISKAKDGFHLADHDFKLISANKQHVRMYLLE